MMVCQNCGASLSVLTYCGVVLCLPCWRKKAGRDFVEVALTVEARRRARPRWPRFYLRTVTLTVRSGPDLEERVEVLLEAWLRLRSRIWWSSRTSGAIAKLEVTWNPREGWHPHLHVLQEGDYLPQADISTEWEAVTRGNGRIVDVQATVVEEGNLEGLVRELTKYVAKPVAPVEDPDGGEKTLPIQAWPADVRSELARLLMGGHRIRWWCPLHRSASWDRCQAIYDEKPWLKSVPCDGAFRIELTGFRRLRFYGTLREAHRHARHLAEERAKRCPECGVGKLRSHRSLEAEERRLRAWGRALEEVPWEGRPAGLHLIQGHKSGGRRPPWAARAPRNPPLETYRTSSGDRPPPVESVAASQTAPDAGEG